MSDKLKTILLVDDDPITIKVAAMSFKPPAPNIALRFAEDGIGAYRYIRRAVKYANRWTYPVPSLILLDINMPRFSGLDFLRWLREKGPSATRDIPVVIVSASGRTAELQCARALGAAIYCPKPLRWADLWRSVPQYFSSSPQLE